jgi:hypothetical protein
MIRADTVATPMGALAFRLFLERVAAGRHGQADEDFVDGKLLASQYVAAVDPELLRPE